MPGPKEGSRQDSGTTTLVQGGMDSSSISEKPEGATSEIEDPVDESTQQWRETVEGTKSPYGKWVIGLEYLELARKEGGYRVHL